MRHLRSAYAAVCLIICLNACLPRLPSTTDLKATNVNALGLGVVGSGAGLPAGSSTSFVLDLSYPADKPPQTVIWEIQRVPVGLTATLVGATTPWHRRLLVTAGATLTADSYTLDVRATVDGTQSIGTTIKIGVTACTETASGSLTQAMDSNLVELITAGKPAFEHGLLIPVQICGGSKHLTVKLTGATAEDGSTLTTLPNFYVFRSEVWPTPDHITAHGLDEGLNVQVPIIAYSSAGQLEADIGAGLYLLIFERDRYAATLTPQTTAAAVTYTLFIR